MRAETESPCKPLLYRLDFDINIQSIISVVAPQPELCDGLRRVAFFSLDALVVESPELVLFEEIGHP
jgi:hypothetical protein